MSAIQLGIGFTVSASTNLFLMDVCISYVLSNVCCKTVHLTLSQKHTYTNLNPMACNPQLFTPLISDPTCVHVVIMLQG